MRTASTAAKPCQGDSLKFYLITGSIYTEQWGTVVIAIVFDESEQRLFHPYMLFITNPLMQEISMVAAADTRQRQSVKVKELQERCIVQAFKLNNQEKYEHVGPKVIRVGVDYCGRGVIGEIIRGMAGAAAVEVSGITVTGGTLSKLRN
ncbi:hypothetical protein Tco_0794036 [Tanacetum coccineum]